MQRERDAIAVLQAEWQHLNRPDRLQAAVDQHLDLQPMKIQQLARLSDLPNRPSREDEIGRKLEALGLLEPTATPKDKSGDARTPDDANPETVMPVLQRARHRIAAVEQPPSEAQRARLMPASCSACASTRARRASASRRSASSACSA